MGGDRDDFAVPSTCTGGVQGILSVGDKRYEVHFLKQSAEHVLVDLDEPSTLFSPRHHRENMFHRLNLLRVAVVV